MSFFKKKKFKKKLFSYQGSKTKYLEIINILINKTNKKYYIEPFLGSGTVLLNLEKEFDKYYIADNNHSITNIFYHCINNFDYEEFLNFFKEKDNFFNFFIKEGYYEFREYFNNNLVNTFSKEEAMGMIILISHSWNNMLRINSENKCTNTFGYRYLTDFKLLRLKYTLNYLKKFKNKIIIYDNYRKCLNIKDSILFIDPPYFLAQGHYPWTKDDLNNMLGSLNFNNDILYTDIQNQYGENKFNNQINLDLLNKMNRSPKNKREVLYHNII